MIGEVLKLAIAVSMVAVLSMGVYALLPEERVPYLEIEMSFNTTNPDTIDITHVGGDPIRVHDVRVEVTNTSNMYDKRIYALTELTNESFWKFPQTLQLNASTAANGNMSEAKVSVVHQRAIIAVGEVKHL